MFFFGSSTTRVTRAAARKIASIARAEGAELVEVNVKPGQAPGINGGRYQRWFTGPNQGNPFDQQLAARVSARIAPYL